MTSVFFWSLCSVLVGFSVALKEKGSMVDSVGDSGPWVRFLNYCKETKAIREKLSNGVPQGKREKLEYRLFDIETRLIPVLIAKMY